jgi:hypothetical protein
MMNSQNHRRLVREYSSELRCYRQMAWCDRDFDHRKAFLQPIVDVDQIAGAVNQLYTCPGSF